MTVHFTIEPTPNPNSMKVTVSATLSSNAATYASAADAQKDEFARKLFEIPGIRSVFVINNFATVTKDPSVEWSALRPKLHDTVQQHFQGK